MCMYEKGLIQSFYTVFDADNNMHLQKLSLVLPLDIHTYVYIYTFPEDIKEH